MKRLPVIIICLFTGTLLTAQDCDSVFVNLKKGTVNGLIPSATQEQVKAALPCFTGDTEDGSDFNCGGGVFYLNHDFYFYTGSDYVEFRKNFSGKLSVPVIGMKKNAAIRALKPGKPVRKKVVESSTYLFFKTVYGCFWIKVIDDIVVELAISNKPAAKIKLCL